MKDVKKVVSTLLRKGAQRVDNVVVKSAYVSEDGTWVVLTLNQNIPMYVQSEYDGVVSFEKGEGNRLFISMISLNAVLGNNPAYASLRNLIMSNDENVKDILSYATIDVIAETVTEGEDYINPFSESTEARTIEHDSIYHHLISLEIGDNGEELLDTLREAKREFAKERALEMLKSRSRDRSASRSSHTVRPRRVEVDVEDNDEDTEDDVENANDAENAEVEAPARTTSRRRS